MPWQFTTNRLIPSTSDKIGAVIINLKNALVAATTWRVRGSGDGVAAFQLMGQTAGVGGSYDIFTSGAGYLASGTGWGQFGSPTKANSITNMRAWVVLQEIVSGRCLTIQRCAQNAQYDAHTLTACMSDGVASTGATANTPPAMTGRSQYLVNTAFNTTAYDNYVSHDANGALIGSTVEWWQQIAVEDVADPAGVASWYFTVWSRTGNASVMGGFWQQLSDVDTLVTPFVAVMGNPTRVWGTVGTAASGQLHTAVPNNMKTLDDSAICTIEVPSNMGIGVTPSLYQQLNNASKWRTHRPWVLKPAQGSKHIGRFKHFFLNKLNREYPSTYGVATADARLTLGHYLVPWATGVGPNTSP
jgi:hypothetical protein